MSNYPKILGGLLGAAVGDAMGAPTETRSMSQIREKFGGYVTGFITPPDDVFARGLPAGSVTDDFSLAYFTTMSIIAHKGVVNETTAKDALVSWSESKWAQMGGPTTSKAIAKLKGEEVASGPYDFLAVDNSKASNGSAMKITPVGLLSQGDISKAIKDAITICMPTHDNNVSLAGACAVAAAVSCAMHETATVENIVEAGLQGAKTGDLFGKKYAKELACPSIYKRIQLAVDIGKKYVGDMPKAMEELSDIIGTGLSAAEAVPCAFGIFVAAQGDTMKSIIAAVNIGNDTDTIATIVGGIAGTFKSFYNAEYLKTINNVNKFNLEYSAKKLEEVSSVE